jgi:hypothetical protein
MVAVVTEFLRRKGVEFACPMLLCMLSSHGRVH